MKRIKKNTKSKKPLAILSADWHIRSTIPKCRESEEYTKAIKDKLIFIFELADEYDIPILHAGDLGDKPEWKNLLLTEFMYLIEGYDTKLYTIAGQHDLINHKIEKSLNAGLGTLHTSCAITYLETIGLKNKFNPFNIFPFHYNQEIKSTKLKGKNIALTHQLIIEDKKEWPDQIATKAKSLLKKFPCYDIILSGDNHKPFVVEYENRYLVNAGSIMRMKSDQKDHKPRVYIWYDDNSVEPVYLPIKKDVVDDSHIMENNDKNDRLEAFVSSVNDNYEVKLSFEDNLKNYMKKNKVKKEIKDIIWENVV